LKLWERWVFVKLLVVLQGLRLLLLLLSSSSVAAVVVETLKEEARVKENEEKQGKQEMVSNFGVVFEFVEEN
jgi:hypothetical protein